MPNFQGAVNEVINQAGLYSSLAGGPQDLKERMMLGKEERTLKKQLKNFGDARTETIQRREEAEASGDNYTAEKLRKEEERQGEEFSRITERARDLQERRYQLNPTPKNYDAMMTARRVGDFLEERQNQAMGRVKEQAQAKKTQRRKFMDYLAKQPTSLGGTVGELPKPLQKQVASQYTKEQRKAMMDRMDREANDGKQK